MPRRDKEIVINAATGKRSIQNSTAVGRSITRSVSARPLMKSLGVHIPQRMSQAPVRPEPPGPRNMQEVFAKLERALTSNQRRTR